MAKAVKRKRSAVRPNLAHYKRMLARGGLRGGGLESMESEDATSAEPDLSGGAIDDRVEHSRSELHQIVREHLGDTPELHEIADQIARDGKQSLTAVGEADEETLASREVMAGLEVIVRTDGSRPSFMVRNGAIDRSTSPLGLWGETLDDSDPSLRRAIECVGRIDDPKAAQGFQGTGILVGENLVLTNRHVLQAIASKPRAADGSWQLKPDIAIDFGHEFRARQSVRRRAVRRVVFAGSKEIMGNAIDHAKLDLALLELDPAEGGESPANPLALDLSPDWGQQLTGIFIIGYPGNPGLFVEKPTLLELLFKSTYGCKRVAPGEVTTSVDALAKSSRKWTLGHDATTLGGNSGSAVIVIGRETVVAAGLHYGGRRTDPRENWCHVVGRVLEETDGISRKTLRQHLQDRGVKLVDR